MKLLHLAIVALMATCLYAKDANPMKVQMDAMVSEAKKSTKQIRSKDLMEMIKKDINFVLVDVREPGEVNNGWIEAVDMKKIPRGLIDFKASSGKVFKKNQKIVIYCKVGGRGALATKALKDLGFNDVANLTGGITQWMKEGYPIVNANGAFKMVPYEQTGIMD